MLLIRKLVLLLFLLLACQVDGQPRRRALLIGIDDYTAVPNERGWLNLSGAVRDAQTMREMLMLLYGFRDRDILLLTDRQATRAAILQAIDGHLLSDAGKGDVLLFYFAGHGSQVANSRSDERDKLDESLVTADSYDLRDKELRPLFLRMLERGARLTVILDHCHSGSGARALPNGTRARGILPDLRDVQDGRDYGPPPESRGALVIAATQDSEIAWETRDDSDQIRGAFSWAWIRAMRDAAANEPAIDTFLRAQARLRGETPYQEPVISGTDTARHTPFLGMRVDRRNGRMVVAVEKIRSDGTVILQGGWANGLTVGSQLAKPGVRLTVTSILGLGRSEARPDRRTGNPACPRCPPAGQAALPVLHAGALLEVVAWASPPATPLRAWIPPGCPVKIERLPTTARAEEADYVLARRGAAYAWVQSDRRQAGRAALPARTQWTADPAALQDALLQLRRIHAWHRLEAPPGSGYPYHLALRRNGRWVETRTLTGGRDYELVLRASAPLPSSIARRHVYAFAVDSHGRSYLIFPRLGSVENRFPLGPAVDEIPLASFSVRPPYGIDTYVLLTTDEPLPDPWILQWDGVRAPVDAGRSPLARLLRETASGTRSSTIVTPAGWSIERVVYRSVPPR